MPRPLKKYPYTEQRGNRLWRYNKVHRVGDRRFRLQSKAIYEKSLDAHNECLEAVRALEACGGDLSKLNPPAAPTFGELADVWEKTVVPATLAASTQQDYTRILKKKVLPEFAFAPVDSITRGDVKTFLLAKVADGVSGSMISQIKAVISGVMTLALDQEIIQVNPALNLGKLMSKEQRSQPDITPFTEEEITKIIAEFRQNRPRWMPYVAFLLLTGVRAGEAIALTWDYLDLAAGRADIQWSHTRGKTTRPKSGKPRTVELPTLLVEILRVHGTEMKKEALAAGRPVPEIVFPTAAGTYMDVANFRLEVWIPALKRAKVPYRKPHNLRHTYATQRVSRGDNIAEVSQQLGHHSVKFTLDRYYHWMPSDAGREQLNAWADSMLGG